MFKLFGTIDLNDNASEGLDKVDGKAEKTGSKFGKLAGGIAVGAAAIGTAAVGAGAAMYGMATKAAGTTDRIDKLSQKIGLSRQGFQEWDFIMSQSGGSVEGLQMGFKTLVNSVDQAVEGTGKGAESFAALGVSVTDASGAVKDQETIFNESVVALQNMEDGTEKAKLANDLFGRSGAEMMPLLNGAAGSIDEMKDKANELGLVMSDDAVDAGVQFTDTMDQLKRSFGTAAASIGVGMMPIITKFADFIIANMPTIQAVMKTVFDWISTAVGFAAEKIGVAFEAIKQLYEAFMSVFYDTGEVPDLMAKIGVSPEMAAAVEEIFRQVIDRFNFFKDSVMLIIDGVKEFLTSALASIREYWAENGAQMLENAKGVFDAIRGAVESAFELIKGVIEQVIGYIVPFLQEKLAVILAFWQENGTQIMQAVENVFNFIKGVIEFIMPIISKIIEVAWERISIIIDTAIGIIMGIVKVFASALTGDFEGVKEGLSRIWTALWDGIKRIFSTTMDIVKSVLKVAFNWMKDTASSIVERMKNAVRDKFQAMKDAISDKMNNAKESIKNIWDDVMDFFSNIDLYQMGKDAIQGLINGIKNMGSSLWTAVSNLVKDNIPGPILKVLDMASPSKLTHQFGEWTGEGLEGGIEDSAKGVNKASVKLAEAAIPPVMQQFPNKSASMSLLKATAPAQVTSPSTVYATPKQPIILQTVLNGRILAEEIYEDAQALMQQRETLQKIGRGEMAF